MYKYLKSSFLFIIFWGGGILFGFVLNFRFGIDKNRSFCFCFLEPGCFETGCYLDLDLEEDDDLECEEELDLKTVEEKLT